MDGYLQKITDLFNKAMRDNDIFGKYDLVKNLKYPEALIQNARKEW